MSKELEALDDLKYKRFYSNSVGVDLIDSYPKLFNTLEQALTPPTQEEVCEALSECLIKFGDGLTSNGAKEVKFSKLSNSFMLIFHDLDWLYITKYEEYRTGFLTIKAQKIQIPLPPHLNTMIGKFYEEETK